MPTPSASTKLKLRMGNAATLIYRGKPIATWKNNKDSGQDRLEIRLPRSRPGCRPYRQIHHHQRRRAPPASQVTTPRHFKETTMNESF